MKQKEIINIRLDEYMSKKIDTILNENKEKYANKSHFIRTAIMAAINKHKN